MKKLLAPALAIALGGLAAACDVATASETLAVRKAATQSPQSVKYFGDEFAEAQRELARRPAEELPQAF